MIKVTGLPTRNREYLIELAIKQIQENPETALQAQYLGIKNYAGFGDQREDHPYGYGPRHGHIVFSIGRYNDQPIEPEKDIAELLAMRDFGAQPVPKNVQDIFYNNSYNREIKWNLQEAKDKLAILTKAANAIANQLKEQQP